MKFINQENPISMVTKIKYNFLLITFLCLVLQGCTSQNTKQFGEGLYDLDAIDFTVPLDTLAIKIPYNITLPLTDGYYDKELKKEVVTDTFAYQRKIKGLKSFNDKTNSPLFYFINTDFKTGFVSFYLDRNENFVAFSFFESREKPFDDILNVLRAKYKQYEVSIKEDDQVVDYYGAEKYKWKTNDKIIEMVRTTKESDGKYTCNISVIKSSTDLNKFPVDKINGL